MSPNTPLIIIDVQCGIDDPSWGERNNLSAELNMMEILQHWRNHAWPIFHIRHDSTHPDSTYFPGQDGHIFKSDVAPIKGEPIIPKTANSAFIRTDLEDRLRRADYSKLYVMGVITNNSVEATVRHGGNLGFDIHLIEDACFTFGLTDWAGSLRSAEDVHAMSLANMDGEYCRVVTRKDVLP